MTLDTLKDLAAMLDRGELINAIKHVRVMTGAGLKEAKDTVEALIAAGSACQSRRDWSTHNDDPIIDMTHTVFTRSQYDNAWLRIVDGVSMSHARSEATYALDNGSADVVVCKVMVKTKTVLTNA
jgi:hypothetical protein